MPQPRDASTVTLTVAGHEPVTLTGEQFARLPEVVAVGLRAGAEESMMEQEPVKQCRCAHPGPHGATWTPKRGWRLWDDSGMEVVFVPYRTVCPWCRVTLLPGGETGRPLQWDAAVANTEAQYPLDVFPDTNVGARVARWTCRNIRAEAARLQEEADREQPE